MTDRSGRSHVYVGAAQSKPGTLAGLFRRAVGEDRWERLTKGLPEAASVQAWANPTRLGTITPSSPGRTSGPTPTSAPGASGSHYRRCPSPSS